MTERFVTHSTFVLERVFDAPVERVFTAWGDQEIKRRWFSPTMEVDFRVGGTERSTFRNQPDGPLFTYEAVFRDIVPNQRIVLTNHMHSDEDRIAVNLVSIEFAPEGDSTRVTITDHGAYLDGRDRGDWREEGVGKQLDRLAIELRPTAPEPAIVDRDEQPYVALRGLTTLQSIGDFAARLPEVYAWLDAHGIAPAGPPIIRYRVIDMWRELDIEVGVPTKDLQQADGGLVADALPAGRYVSVTHVGHPQEHIDVITGMFAWGEARGLTWDRHPSDAGEAWGGRIEIQHLGPIQGAEPDKYESELLFRLAD